MSPCFCYYPLNFSLFFSRSRSPRRTSGGLWWVPNKRWKFLNFRTKPMVSFREALFRYSPKKLVEMLDIWKWWRLSERRGPGGFSAVFLGVTILYIKQAINGFEWSPSLQDMFIHIHPEFEDMSDLNLPGSNMETPKVHMMHQMAPNI